MPRSFASRVVVPQDVLVSDVGGESVLLNLKTEQYFGLDEVGTRMWRALTESTNIEQAYQTLLAEYDVPQQQLRQDLDELMDRLIQQGLLEVND